MSNAITIKAQIGSWMAGGLVVSSLFSTKHEKSILAEQLQSGSDLPILGQTNASSIEGKRG